MCRNIRIALFLCLVALSSSAEVKNGGAKLIPLDGGKYNVWTKRVGSGSAKLLTLHGGPGLPHDYLEVFEDFVPQKGIEFYYYDQLGVGNSDQPDDASLWTVDRYRDEVEQVRQGLGIDRIYLFGHSWGGMLAIEYALAHQDHLKAVIISNMTASSPSYMQYANELRAKLSKEDQATLAKYEALGQYEAPEYNAILLGKIYAEHICRIDPWPEPLMRSVKKMNATIYNTMQGPNEFVITGNFKDWDRWNDLASIRIPTLILGAIHDEMRPDDLRRMGKLIPRSRTVILAGSHMSMYDDQEAYFRELVRFIKEVEAGTFKPDAK